MHQITGEQRYAEFAADPLSRYADCYLDLGFQRARNTNPPGRIFHQTLNENMWQLLMSIGYGCIKHTLTAERRNHIEIRTLGHDDTASVIELEGKRLHLIVMVSNRPDITADSVTEVSFNGSTYRWTGFFDCQCE